MGRGKQLRVLVSDDSAFVGNLIRTYLEEAGIEVAAVRQDGRSTLAAVRELKPDVITMGLELKDKHGLDVLREIMMTQPTPVVMVSGAGGRAAAATLQALEEGAVDFVLKFSPAAPVDPEMLRLEIVSKVRAAAEVKVVRSLAIPSGLETREIPTWTVQLPVHKPAADSSSPRGRLPGGVVVIGGSTGGPVALRGFLAGLPANFPAPIIVVQHIPASFTRVLATQLGSHTQLQVREASAGEKLEPGDVVVAPGGFHTLLTGHGTIELSEGPAIKGHRPSIDVTMQSAAMLLGPATQGILLSGMGDDGVDGLFAIKSCGGSTYAQNLESCVVDGMPRSALEKGVVGTMATLTQIGKLAYTRAHELATSTRSEHSAERRSTR